MNQILETSNNGEKNNKRFVDTKKIIIIFCAIIMTFAIIIIAVHTVKLYKQRAKEKEYKKAIKPEIQIEQIDGSSVKLMVKHEQGISAVSYNWNNKEIVNLPTEGKDYIETIILIPQEPINTLKIKAVGTNGTTEEIARELKQEGDITKPKINLNVQNDLVITATDETEIAYLTYKWNDEEEVVIYPTEEDIKIIEQTIEIRRGKNKLVITASDAIGNIATVSKTFKGIKEPEIVMAIYGDLLRITAIHDKGFKKIIYTINDKEYVYDEKATDYDSTKAKVIFDQTLNVGDNLVTVKAYSNEDENSEKVMQSIATYNP